MIDRKFIFTATNPCNGKTYTNKNALILCAKDLAVPVALEAYKAECVKLGSNPEHIESIGLLIERVKQYQLVECHVPDTELECEIARCVRGEGLEETHNMAEIFDKQKQEDTERSARMFVENARNAMRAVKITIEEGDEEEAIRLINEALGED